MRGPDDSARSRPKALAFYLPQFHPIPENDAWWGRGFTEWANVARAKPLFPGHYQPHMPGELGYYDLRVPEVREAQAELARSHGIHGFIYYHYWFHGKRLLERPFNEVLASGSPDFPFALCWANGSWTRNWDGEGTVLMDQAYSEEDDLAHILWLLDAFADKRYITIDGRPLLLIYRPMMLPDSNRTIDLWRREVKRAGFPDLYVSWVESWESPPGGPGAFGFDASVSFMPPRGPRHFLPLESARSHRIFDYEDAAEAHLGRPKPEWKRFPSVMVGWDNTARRPVGATIFEGATPDAYARWLERTVESVADVREEENYIFLLAWNEWAEGNHLEPDQHSGRAFLEATRAVLSVQNQGPEVATDEVSQITLLGSASSVAPVDDGHPASLAIANAAELIARLATDPGRLVLDLDAGSGQISQSLAPLGVRYRALEADAGAVERMRSRGIDAVECDLSDLDSVERVLDASGPIGALLMLDGLGNLVDPHLLLAKLSAWSLAHYEPLMVVSVPNIAHFDLGMRLLCGQWNLMDEGLLDSSQLRFFTEETLRRLFSRCGWHLVDSLDLQSMASDRFDPDLYDSLPPEMVGALRTLATTYNPAWSTTRFVWALAPEPIEDVPSSFSAAVAEGGDSSSRQLFDRRTNPVSTYLESIGLLASEASRRAIVLAQLPRPGWQRAGLRMVRSTRLSARAYERLRRRMG